MKRYLAIPLLAAISAASFVAGYSLAKPATPALLMPLTLTIHTLGGTRTVHATYSSMAYGDGGDASSVSVDYRSDRIFCSNFEAFFKCIEVYP